MYFQSKIDILIDKILSEGTFSCVVAHILELHTLYMRRGIIMISSKTSFAGEMVYYGIANFSHVACTTYYDMKWIYGKLSHILNITKKELYTKPVYKKQAACKIITIHQHRYSGLYKMSLLTRKQTICIFKNKDADQLCTADQRLVFPYMDSTISLLLKSRISSC